MRGRRARAAGGAPPPGLGRAARAAAALRRRAGGSVSLAALAGVALVFLAAILLPEPAWVAPGSLLPFLAFLLVAAVLAAAGYALGRVGRRVDLPGLAEEAEETAGLRAGELRGALELSDVAAALAGGTTGDGGRHPFAAGSPALARLHLARVEGALAARGTALFPRSSRLWGRRLAAAAAAAALALGLAALAAAARPQRAALAAGALARPWRVAFPPPLPPLAIEPRGAEVERGTPLRVRISAPERQRVRLAWRVEGEVPEFRLLAVDAEADVATGLTTPVHAPTRYWAEDGRGAASDTFLVRPLDPLLLTALSVTVEFPPWLGRPAEEHARPLPPLAVPPGSRLRIRGSANRLLTAASLRETSSGRALPLEVEGERFEGGMRPRSDGAWVWELAARGEPRSGPPDTLRVAVAADSLPTVAIVFPGADTVLGASLTLPLVIDARDDIGVRSVEVVSWRASASGTRGLPESRPVTDGADEDEEERRLILRPLLELGGRDLLPGDTVLYFARVRDGNPEHAAVSSDTFRARVPGLGELRERALSRAEEMAARARELGEGAGRLEREAREAERRALSGTAQEERAPAAGRQTRAGERSSFAATEEGRRILSDAESVERRLEELGRELGALQGELERSGLMDEGVREQLRQLEELYRELLDSGLRERIEELRRALRELDAQGLRSALDRVSAGMREVRAKLEQSVALMERVAMEQALEDLESRAQRLAEEQRSAAATDERDAGWTRAEERLAAEAERMAEELRRLEERLAAARAADAADSVAAAGERSSRAAESMRTAAGEVGGAERERREASRAEGERTPDGRGAGGEERRGAADPARREAAEPADRRPEEGGERAPPRGGAPGQERRAGEGEATGEEEAAGGSTAGQAARSAAREMESAASSLRGARQRLRTDWRAEALSAVERATEEALELAREQARLLGEVSSGGEPEAGARARQAALRQGLDNLATSLAEAGRKTALLDRRVGPATARAAQGMDRMLQSLDPAAGAARATREEADAVVESLNELAIRLLATRRAIEASSSATGMEEALDRLARMAQAQGGLNQEAGGLMMLQQTGQAIAGGLQRLAEEQAAIGRQLRELASQPGGSQLLGRPEQMASEAEQIARRLRSAGLDPETLRRQERLFRRLLDAGRSLEKEEEDPRRRESRTARELGPRAVPALDSAALSGPRWPHPDPVEMRELPAAYRALVLEYFDRLNRAAAAGRGVGEGERDGR